MPVTPGVLSEVELSVPDFERKAVPNAPIELRVAGPPRAFAPFVADNILTFRPARAWYRRPTPETRGNRCASPRRRSPSSH